MTEYRKAAYTYPKVLDFEFQFTRNQYEIFMEEWIGFPSIPRTRTNYSPGCDSVCPAVALPGMLCTCGAQEFYYRVHQWHGMFAPYVSTECPCFHCAKDRMWR